MLTALWIAVVLLLALVMGLGWLIYTFLSAVVGPYR